MESLAGSQATFLSVALSFHVLPSLFKSTIYSTWRAFRSSVMLLARKKAWRGGNRVTPMPLGWVSLMVFLGDVSAARPAPGDLGR